MSLAFAQQEGDNAPPLSRDPDGFLTPSGPATPSSRRKRKQRLSTFSGLLDPLRKDLSFERGSISAKRRAMKRRMAEQGEKTNWKDELFSGIPDDSNSPVHRELR